MKENNKNGITTVIITIFSILLIAVIIFIIKNGGEKVEEENMTDDELLNQKQDMIYVALGDSITKGYGLENEEKERYSTLITTSMMKNINCKEYNYGVNGQTSSDLIENIKKGRIDMLSNADLVTICIGANDVLLPLESFFYYYSSLFYYYEAAGEEIKWNQDDKELFEEEYKNVCEMIEDSCVIQEENLKYLIDAIRDVNQNCRIIFMTVYNPYRGLDFSVLAAGEKINMEKFADYVVCRINNNIKDRADELGYEVADVYQAFEETEKDVLNSGVKGNVIDVDDHPNKAGHELIAEIFVKQIMSEAGSD